MGYDNASDLAERDEMWERVEQMRMNRDGYLIRPITRALPPVAGNETSATGSDAASVNGPQSTPVAGEFLEQETQDGK